MAIDMTIPALREALDEANDRLEEPPFRLPTGRGTVHPQQGESMRGLVALTPYWVICRLERPTASGVTCLCYPAHEVERVDFDDA